MSSSSMTQALFDSNPSSTSTLILRKHLSLLIHYFPRSLTLKVKRHETRRIQFLPQLIRLARI